MLKDTRKDIKDYTDYSDYSSKLNIDKLFNGNGEIECCKEEKVEKIDKESNKTENILENTFNVYFRRNSITVSNFNLNLTPITDTSSNFPKSTNHINNLHTFSKKTETLNQYKQKIMEIGSISNTKDYYCFMEAQPPSKLPQYCSLILFKQGCFPSWETNPKGGMVSFNVSVEDIDTLWSIVTFLFVVDNDGFGIEENLVGVIVKRISSVKGEIQMWCKEFDSELVAKLIKGLGQKLGLEKENEEMFYSRKFF